MNLSIDWEAIDDALTGGHAVTGEGLLVAGIILAVERIVGARIGAC